MKPFIKMLVFVVMINVSIMTVNSLDVFNDVAAPSGLDTDQLANITDAESLIESWNPPDTGTLFGDVLQALMSLRTLFYFVYAIPVTLAAIGIPSLIVTPMYVIVTLIWFLGVIDLISGGGLT